MSFKSFLNLAVALIVSFILHFLQQFSEGQIALTVGVFAQLFRLFECLQCFCIRYVKSYFKWRWGKRWIKFKNLNALCSTCTSP